MTESESSREFFAAPGGDRYYEDLRTDLAFSSLRSAIAKWWKRYRPYADLDFLTKARHDDFLSCFWEMYLGNALLELGISLTERRLRSATKAGNPGPDFRTSSSPPVWIEAVAPEPGHGPDSVPAAELGKVREVPDSEAKLRYLSSIRSKAKDRLRYVDEGLVGVGDPYVIAVSTSKISRVPDLEPPRLVRAVFGLGMPTLTINRERKSVVETGMSEQAEVKKQSRAGVSTRIFVDPENPNDQDFSGYAGVSAVLACDLTPYNCQPPYFDSSKYLMGDAFCLVHNPLALNPLLPALVTLGVEYWVDEDDRVVSTDWLERGKTLPRRL